MDIAVYLFTGFLESGKTSFIQETLEDSRFNTGEKTLVLLCEEGEVELNEKKFASENVFIEIIDDVSKITAKNLKNLCKNHNAERVVIEYNGMWQLPLLYANMPSNWIIYQEITFVYSNTFLTYNANMRNLVVEKLQNCELVVFNRYNTSIDKEELHKIVRGINRRTDIIYESKDGQIEYDSIEDPLPFDIDAPIIQVGISDYAIWYRDLVEEMPKYNGKTVKFTGAVAVDKKMPSDCFIIGRPVMTCCADDIAYKSVLCVGRKPSMKSGDWISLTAEIRVEKHKLYQGEGPVLYLKDYAMTSAPTDPVATFY